jgi:hypothetical protein
METMNDKKILCESTGFFMLCGNGVAVFKTSGRCPRFLRPWGVAPIPHWLFEKSEAKTLVKTLSTLILAILNEAIIL